MAFSPRLICRRLISRSLAHTHPMSTAIKKTSSSSPWLMLPPTFKYDTSSIDYNFYILSENRVLTRPQNNVLTMMPKPIHDLTFCGSSHGWLALFNPHTHEVFLYDPISGRHINLPPIHNLPIFAERSTRSVTKLILSCSPDEDEHNCRAVIIYNCRSALAFCCPGRCKEWTQIGKTNRTSYKDIVYSSRQNLFFCLNKDCKELETWGLSDPSSPRLIKAIKTVGEIKCPDLSDMSAKDYLSDGVEHLAVADDHVLLVTREVMGNVAPDGSYVQYYYRRGPLFFYPHMTVDFSIDVYDQEEGGLKPLEEESLGDVALFIGPRSDSVALSATLFPELKPNSIYFTDPRKTSFDPSSDAIFGGHDIGILDYGKKTVSPCYYPCDVRSLKRVVPLPMWFFPRGV